MQHELIILRVAVFPDISFIKMYTFPVQYGTYDMYKLYFVDICTYIYCTLYSVCKFPSLQDHTVLLCARGCRGRLGPAVLSRFHVSRPSKRSINLTVSYSCICLLRVVIPVLLVISYTVLPRWCPNNNSPLEAMF